MVSEKIIIGQKGFANYTSNKLYGTGRMNALKSVAYAGVDAFTDMSGSDSKRREAYLEIIASLLSFIVAIIIVSFIGKWVWNNILLDLFTIVKPAKSIWQILGLMIFLALIR